MNVTATRNDTALPLIAVEVCPGATHPLPGSWSIEDTRPDGCTLRYHAPQAEGQETQTYAMRVTWWTA